MKPYASFLLVLRMGVCASFVCITGLCRAQHGTERSEPARTRWVVAGALLFGASAEDRIHPKPAGMETRSLGWTGRAELGYRPGRWGAVVLAFDHARYQSGWSANEELQSSFFVNTSPFSSYRTSSYTCDLLSMENAVSTLSFLHRIAIRPYPGRRRFALGLQAAWGLRVHHVGADLGVVLGHNYTNTEHSGLGWGGWSSYVSGETDPGAAAFRRWDEREVVRYAQAVGVSFALEFRVELFCTRSVSLFTDVQFTQSLSEPRITAAWVAEVGNVATYEVRTTNTRAALGLAVHF